SAIGDDGERAHGGSRARSGRAREGDKLAAVDDSEVSHGSGTPGLWGGPPVPQRPPSRVCFVWLRLISLARSGSRGPRADQGVRPTMAGGITIHFRACRRAITALLKAS